MTNHNTTNPTDATPEVIERIKKILASHNISMSVNGCGCCGSPWVSFKYKNEVLLRDADWVCFQMEEPSDG